MHRSLNRGAWAKLEKYELGLKNKNNEVNVSISLTSYFLKYLI